MEKIIEKEFVCKFCNKKFPSGKSLGGHIRIHTNEYSVASDGYNGKNPKKKKREITALKQQQQQQFCCRECGKGFDSLKALCNHMDFHCEGEKMVMDSQSDTETSSGPTMKRSKRVMKQPSSESFSNGSSSSTCEIDQEHKNMALSLMMMSMDPKGHNLVVNSLAESSENNSDIKLSSGEQLKVVLKTDRVEVDDQLRSAANDHDDNDATLSDSYSSDSDYFMNGPKKSDSDISVDGSLTGFNRFSNGDELRIKEGGSKYELRKSKRVLPSYESDSCEDTNSKIRKSSDSKSPMVKKANGANKNGRAHECPICFKVFKSGQALGGHKRSHSIENQEHRIKHKAADMKIDLNLPAMEY